MNNVVLNEWVPMQADVIIPDEVQFISVDTRDFHWFMSEELPNPSKANRFMNSGMPIVWSTTTPESLFFLINELRIRCKDNKWNFLQSKNGDYWNMKYIWFKREESGRFSVWTRNWETTLNTTHGLAAIVDWKQNED